METIKNIGKINIIDDIKDGKGKRVLKNFMRLLAEEFARQSKKYIEYSEDTPFAYSEKQLHSVILPAISKISDSFLFEAPVIRKLCKTKKHNRFESHGWVDYFCVCGHGDFYILLELKHSYDNLKTDIIRKDTFDKWKQLKEQMDKLKSEAKIWTNECKGVILVPLHVITIREHTKIEDSKSFNNSDSFLKIQQSYNEKLKNPNPNWSALWILNKDLAKNTYYEDNIYPGVIMLSYINDSIIE